MHDKFYLRTNRNFRSPRIAGGLTYGKAFRGVQGVKSTFGCALRCFCQYSPLIVTNEMQIAGFRGK